MPLTPTVFFAAFPTTSSETTGRATIARRVESFGPLGYGIHFRLAKLTAVDKNLESLMREASTENAPARKTPEG